MPIVNALACVGVNLSRKIGLHVTLLEDTERWLPRAPFVIRNAEPLQRNHPFWIDAFDPRQLNQQAAFDVLPVKSKLSNDVTVE